MARFSNYTPEPQVNSGFDSVNLSQGLKSQIKTCQQVSLNTHREAWRQIQQIKHTLFLRMCNVIKLRHPSLDGLVLPEGQRDEYKTPRRQATASKFYTSRLSSCLSSASSIQEAFKPLFSFNVVFFPPQWMNWLMAAAGELWPPQCVFMSCSSFCRAAGQVGPARSCCGCVM